MALLTRPVLVWLALSSIWGSTWLFIKLGLRDLPPVSFAGIRFVVAAAILWGIVAARRIPVPREARAWALIAGTGFIQFTLNYGLLFWGERHVSSGLAAVLQATIPAFGLVIAHAYLPQDRLSPAKVAGVALGIGGVAMIFSNQMTFEGKDALLGSVAIVAGAFCAAYASVLVKARGRDLDPVVLSAGQMTVGLVPLLFVGFSLEGSPFAFHWTTLAWICVLYLAIMGSVVAFILYYWLIRRMDVTKTMLISLVTPVLAVLLGMATLGETFTWRVLAGTAAIVSGIAFIGLLPRRK